MLGAVVADVYEIRSIVGEGGMGVVYRAYDRACARDVAVKCLHPNLVRDREIRQRFAREARVLRAWRHPAVVAVFDFLERDNLLGIVMELIDGPTLVEELEKWRGRMPLPVAAGIFVDLLCAMEEAHQRGIVHRDLKPDNILLRPTHGRMVPKIVDFGIAKLLEGTSYTLTGALMGTPRYMAPEQVQSPQTADHRCDIYSLGITLYQLCTGRAPFEAENHFALMMEHVSKPPPPASTWRADIPEALDRLILDALAKDPRQRPQSCAEFRQRFESILPTSPRVDPPELAPVTECQGEMVLVPAGPFRMGLRRREVELDSFYLDRTPVTNRQFKKFLDVTGYCPEDSSRFVAHWGTDARFPRELDEHPVVYTSWYDALAYAKWAGKRLPTEAEWEKAARGVDGRRYPWGAAEPSPERAHFGARKRGTVRVGSLPAGASPYGILDLAGNVWEWCEDVDDPGFYADGPMHNPRNPSSGELACHVMRGGSWMYGPRAVRTTSRTSFEPHYRFGAGGFRCARDP
jgi:serine/threonine-protein kinase